MRSYNSFSENQVKHLEAIQAEMVRHETMGIHTKRWSFVLTAGLLALAVQQQECLLGAVSVVITFGLVATGPRLPALGPTVPQAVRARPHLRRPGALLHGRNGREVHRSPGECRSP